VKRKSTANREVQNQTPISVVTIGRYGVDGMIEQGIGVYAPHDLHVLLRPRPPRVRPPSAALGVLLFREADGLEGF
jgi:hypothetical protein